MRRILCLSNGHGEDMIAVAILDALRAYPVTLTALPIVGQGNAYRDRKIPIVSPTQNMPSGGFIYMDPKQLWRDLRQGLGGLTSAQLQALTIAAQDVDFILAVGDIVVQLFAWRTGLPYAFVGTAKSDYYLGGKPSVFAPWERWLMCNTPCFAVYPRDRITTVNLQQLGVPHVYDLGNPMMDGLTPQGFDWGRLPVATQAQVALILPGSRTPEAYANFQLLLSAFSQLEPALVGLAALTGSLDTPELVATLSDWHYQRLAPDLARLQRGERRVYLVWGAFADCLNRADLVLAMTGTATEQAVGLGKPVISLVGGGPQFTYRFAEAQTRLLGPSVTLISSPEAIAPVARKLLTDLTLRAELAANGLARMGTPGAAQRIAQHLMAADGTV